MAGERPKVLFVCVHNAGRSQMAAAFANALAAGRVVAESAGSRPAERVNPVVVEAMREVGIDLRGSVPRGLDSEVVRGVDLVVTMGCGDACPVVPGARREDWDLPDPAGQGIEIVRRIRDEVRSRVERLLAAT